MEYESKEEQEAKEGFKHLSLSKKIEYIWDYYKWYFISAILCILILGYAYDHYILHPDPATYTGIGFYNIQITADETSIMSSSLGNKLIQPEENRKITIASTYNVTQDPLYEDALRQRLDTMLLAKELDILVAPEEIFKTLAYSGYVVNIDEQLAEDDLKPFKDANEILYSTNEQDSTTRPYGIKVNNSPYFKEVSGFINTNENIYMGFVRFNIRPEESTKTAKEIYKGIH